MRNFYQETMWDHTSYHEDFYQKARSEPECIDWSMTITQLLRSSGVSVCELSRYMKGEGVDVNRDHLEALKIGKVVKPRKSVEQVLLELTMKHVPQGSLRFAVKGGM